MDGWASRMPRRAVVGLVAVTRCFSLLQAASPRGSGYRTLGLGIARIQPTPTLGLPTDPGAPHRPRTNSPGCTRRGRAGPVRGQGRHQPCPAGRSRTPAGDPEGAQRIAEILSEVSRDKLRDEFYPYKPKGQVTDCATRASSGAAFELRITRACKIVTGGDMRSCSVRFHLVRSLSTSTGMTSGPSSAGPSAHA